jgi:hypothetical protein
MWYLHATRHSTCNSRVNIEHCPRNTSPADPTFVTQIHEPKDTLIDTSMVIIKAWGRENWELLMNRCSISAKQDEQALDICLEHGTNSQSIVFHTFKHFLRG